MAMPAGNPGCRATVRCTPCLRTLPSEVRNRRSRPTPCRIHFNWLQCFWSVRTVLARPLSPKSRSYAYHWRQLQRVRSAAWRGFAKGFKRTQIIGRTRYVGSSGEFFWVRIGFIFSPLFLTVAVILASARPPQAPQKNQYIDSRACAACHSRIYESYRRTSMGQSRPRPRPPIPSKTIKNSQLSITLPPIPTIQ